MDALCSMQNLPSPHGHGWIVETNGNGSHIHVYWNTQLLAPKALLELVSANAMSAVPHSNVRAFVCCTDACDCRNCKNSSKQIVLSSPVLLEEETPESD